MLCAFTRNRKGLPRNMQEEKEKVIQEKEKKEKIGRGKKGPVQEKKGNIRALMVKKDQENDLRNRKKTKLITMLINLISDKIVDTHFTCVIGEIVHNKQYCICKEFSNKIT